MRRYKRTHVATVIVSLIFAVTVLFGIMFFAGFWTLGKTYNVSAYVSNARGIAEDSTVFEAGLPVGIVTGIQRSGPDAILSLRISKGPTPLPVDSRIQLGLRSLAGEADVLLLPGHSSEMVRNGGSLQLSQDNDYTEVDQILNQFAGHTTAATRQFFQGFGGGLQGQGQNLNQTLGGFAALVNDSPPLTSTLAAQHGQVADIVQNFGNIMAAIGQRTEAVEQFARGSRETFDVVANRDVQFGRLFVGLNHGIDGSIAITRAITANAHTIDPVLLQLSNDVTKLQPAINELTPASQKGIQVLRALGSAAPALKNVLINLTSLKPSATSALTSLHALTCQVDPITRYIAPYGPDIAAFFEDFGAATDSYDSNHELLTSALVDPTHLVRGIYGNASQDQALNELINVGIFKNLAGAQTGFDANPGPGHAGRHDLDVGDAGPIQFGAHNVYPHVTADCASTLPGGFHIG
jgi:phospholipid/cholesterol/gamma-HCH transport system substrate-binding protein